MTISSGTTVSSATLALGATPFTGTLFSSYLVRFNTTKSAGSGDGAGIRVANTNSTPGEHFNSYADTRLATSTNIGVSYDGGSAVSVTGATGLVENTTYLVISRFTNVGTALSVGTTGVATMFALTAAQYDSYLASANPDTYLDTTALGTNADQVTARVSDAPVTTGTLSFVTGQGEHFVSVGNSTSFDEIRYGSTLADVIAAVPEPTTAGLLLAAGSMLLLRRRRAS